MARPKKNTVDYFPHPVNDGTRMFIMEQRFGDKGYCCYYKLLQFLGKSDNHFIDFTIPKNRAFLCALIRCNEPEIMEMIQALIEIDAFDKDLWDQKRIIWSSEFVDSIKVVYINRKSQIPNKPSYDVVSISSNMDYGIVSTQNKPQSIVEYTTVDNNREDKIKQTNVFESLKKFFGFEDEISHIDKWQKIRSFLISIEESGKFYSFEKQFDFYKKYKNESKEKSHGFISFIMGAWDSENWEHKYNNFKDNNNGNNIKGNRGSEVIKSGKEYGEL